MQSIIPTILGGLLDVQLLFCFSIWFINRKLKWGETLYEWDMIARPFEFISYIVTNFDGNYDPDVPIDFTDPFQKNLFVFLAGPFIWFSCLFLSVFVEGSLPIILILFAYDESIFITDTVVSDSSLTLPLPLSTSQNGKFQWNWNNYSPQEGIPSLFAEYWAIE
jgi:hypothetical protein